MIARVHRVKPWASLARLIGPLMIWLALSYLFVAYLLSSTDWIENIFNEEGQIDTISLIIAALIFALFGIFLTIWGFSNRRIDFVEAELAPGKILCPRCNAELLETTSICPYCGGKL